MGKSCRLGMMMVMMTMTMVMTRGMTRVVLGVVTMEGETVDNQPTVSRRVMRMMVMMVMKITMVMMVMVVTRRDNTGRKTSD